MLGRRPPHSTAYLRAKTQQRDSGKYAHALDATKMNVSFQIYYESNGRLF